MIKQAYFRGLTKVAGGYAQSDWRRRANAGANERAPENAVVDQMRIRPSLQPLSDAQAEAIAKTIANVNEARRPSLQPWSESSKKPTPQLLRALLRMPRSSAAATQIQKPDVMTVQWLRRHLLLKSKPIPAQSQPQSQSTSAPHTK